MAKGKRELTLVPALVMVAMAMVVMSSMGGVAAAPSFPLDCSSFVLDGRPAPLKFCCMEVQDQFLLKKSVGIGGYCKAVKAVKRFDGPLAGTELDLALSIPEKCGLSGYHAKGFQCAGTYV